MRRTNSSTGRPARSLTLKEEKILKVKQLVSGVTIMVNTKNGMLSILTKLMLLQQRERTKTSDSTSTDHSTLDQECQ
jgi:hypothetical protein